MLSNEISRALVAGHESPTNCTAEPVPRVSSSDAPLAVTTHVFTADHHIRVSESTLSSINNSDKKPRPALQKRKSLHTSFELPTYIEELDVKINSGEAWDEIPSYDSSQETRPADKVPFFHAAFAEAEDLLTQNVIQYILNAICSLELKKPSAELTYMKKRVEGLLSPSYRPPVIVGVRGPAGKGKTSLINALLSVDELAHTSSGSVGTYVPVEFVPLGDQIAPYGFEVRVVSLKESVDQITSYWRDYYTCLLSKNREYLDDAVSSDLVQPARDVFLALFSDIANFETEEKADDFLKQAKCFKDPIVLFRLLLWTTERYDKMAQIVARQPFFAHTVSDLGDIMEPFVQTASFPIYPGGGDIALNNSVWPFVTLGRVALNNPLLEAGLILADLPGNNDCNVQRVRLAEKYNKKCQVTIVVDEIKRAADNESLKRSIYDAWRWKRRDSVIVVLTHADDLGDERSFKAPLSTEEEETLETLRNQRSEKGQMIKMINTQLKDKKNRRNQALRRDLGDEKERYETHIRHVNILRRRCLIGARNRQVKVALRKWFRERTGIKDPLPVFCVSTTEYMELVRDDENRTLMDPPDFTAESTEIVALRQYMLTMVKKRGQDQSMANYYRLVQHLVKDMTLACTNFKPMYKRQKLVKLVKSTQEGIPGLCRAQLKGLLNSLTPVFDAFTNSIDEWNQKAGKACDKWGNYNAGSYWAFLRHNGKHKRPSKGYEDWNEILIECAVEGLEPLLDAVREKGCTVLEAGLIQALHEKMDNLERELRLNLDQSHAKYNEFFDSMHLLNKQIEAHVEAEVAKLQDSILMLDNECFSLKVARANPFFNRMEDIYESVRDAHAQNTGKPGIHNSRRTMFKEAVMDKTSGPYTAIEKHIRSHSNTMLLAAEVQLQKGCDDVFDKIYHHLDQICPVLEGDGIRALERGQELNKYLEDAKRILDGPAKEALLRAGVKVA